jgi:four helix bundle protein
MLVTRFEDLEVWKLAREIVKDIYSDFRGINDFEFKNQITSAGISVMNNISEGFSRESKKEFHQFLNIAKGSSGEIKNMYYIGEDQNYISSFLAEQRRERCEKEKNMIAKFMKHLKDNKTASPQNSITAKQKSNDNK